MTDHPITPTPELVQQWMNEICDDPPGNPHFVSSDDIALAALAAKWGADTELDACCEWIPRASPWDAEKLRAARRPPKPPSLKKQALSEVAAAVADGSLAAVQGATIRLALEGLPND